MYNAAENVVYKLPRTQIQNIYSHKTTFNAGKMIPIMAKEIIPKDFINLDINVLIKTTTPQAQVMDTLFADVFFIFVPRRLIFKKFKEFMGENLNNIRRPQIKYTLPKTTAPTGGWTQGTIADYLGIPTKVPNIQVDSGYFRGYVLCWNEYCRDQQRQDYADFTDDEANETGSNGENIITDAIKGGKPLPMNKLKDIYTTTLLQPQAGEPVTMPLGNTAPIALDMNKIGTPMLSKQASDYRTIIASATNTAIYSNNQGNLQNNYKNTVIDPNETIVADLTQASAATINQLRQAFAMQRMLETINKSARYVEQLVNRWGITNPSDATLQRPEYIGGFQFPLNMEMVVQTSQGTQTSPLGQIGGFSNTLSRGNNISGAFEEHGILYGFICVRNRNTYQQGLAPKFTRTDMEDFYNPEYANAIGDVAVKNREIYAQGNDQDDLPFGYAPYGYEYRNEPSIVTGQFRSNATNPFDNWHYADDYTSLPVNNETWIQSNKANIDRTLTIDSTEGYDQFYCEISFNEIATRSIPAHNIPGYITSM